MDDSIHVATFNVNYICASPSNEKIAFTIANCGAQVVCLQESNESWESFISSRSDIKNVYPIIRFHNHSNPWGGFAVLSKFNIESWRILNETHPCWYPAGLITFRIPRTMTHSSSEQAAHLLQLLIIHLRAPVIIAEKPYFWGSRANWIGGWFSVHVKKERMNELQTFVSELCSNLPTVILGDFNERRKISSCLQYLKKLGFENAPKRTTIGSRFSCRGTTTWSLNMCGMPLLCLDYDHIVYSKNLLNLVNNTAYIHRAGGSDHCLVSAKFQFHGS